MKLWDMLGPTLYHQMVWIYVANDFDQNEPIFKGEVEEARADENVFDYLMHEVLHYEYNRGVQLILLRSEEYKKRIEERYSEEIVKKWDNMNPKTRHWRYSSEIEMELRGIEIQNQR